jgi:hypothetical protein
MRRLAVRLQRCLIFTASNKARASTFAFAAKAVMQNYCPEDS